MKKLHERKLLIEIGETELTEIEKLTYKFSDCMKDSHLSYIKYNETGDFKEKGNEIRFRTKTTITPDYIQDMHAHNNYNAEEEIVNSISEYFISESFNCVYYECLKNKTNFRALLTEKIIDSRIRHDYQINLVNLVKNVINNYNNDYILIVSAEIAAILDDNLGGEYLCIGVETLEEGCYAMGIEVYGYIGGDSKSGIKVLKNPYAQSEYCVLVKDLNKAEFHIEYQIKELTTEPDDFSPKYKNHIMTVNIPDSLRFITYKVENVPQWQENN